MHPVILESLEEYLSGTLLPGSLREFEAHLTTCPECREEVRGMQEVSSLFTALRPVEAYGAFSRVCDAVAAQAAASRAPSFWSLFSLDPAVRAACGFRVAADVGRAGSFLVTREVDTNRRQAGPSR